MPFGLHLITPVQLAVCAVALFASMFIPLPSPFGLAMALWALAMGLPLPAILGIYIFQDVLAYTAIARVVRSAAGRSSHRLHGWRNRIPARLRQLTARSVRPVFTGDGGLFSATMVSFYAGCVLSSLRSAAPIRSAVIVIGLDCAKYINGLAMALGAIHLLPSSPWSMAAGSMIGLIATPVFKLALNNARRVPVPAYATIRSR
jgi:hypothetical protein